MKLIEKLSAALLIGLLASSATAKETPACRKKALVFLVGVEEAMGQPSSSTSVAGAAGLPDPG